MFGKFLFLLNEVEDIFYIRGFHTDTSFGNKRSNFGSKYCLPQMLQLILMKAHRL